MNISVMGLGYIGSVSAACFSHMGHDVIGVDINPRKVDMINRGQSPVVEKDIDHLIREQVSRGKLRATINTDEAVKHAQVTFICVGTPSNGSGSLNYQHVERVCTDIARSLKRKNEYISIVLRSTVLPGVAEGVMLPLLERISGKIANVDFGFAVNPEFLREGSSVYDFYHPPKTLIGELDARTADLLEELYASIDAPLFRIRMGEASMVKYADNAFHAIKVSFANEVGRLCKAFDIDSRVVMDVFTKDVKLNLSAYYLRPGFAFGGSCLPKDLRALTHRAKQADVLVPLLNSVMSSNAEHIRHALEMVRASGRKRIGVLGLSFKGGTDDLRESPMVTLVEQLIGKGYRVRIFDKYVSLARLIGSNKEYIKREVPHIAKLMCKSVEDVVKNSDIVLIGNQAEEHEEVVGRLCNGHKVIDLSGLESAKNGNLNEVDYEGICW